MTNRYVSYPPGLGTVQVPSRGRTAARGALLYTACTRSAVAGHQAAWSLLRLAGPHLMPGARRPLAVPSLTAADIEDLWEDLRAHLGTFDGVAVAAPRQARRAGCVAMLTRSSRAFAVVKVRRPGAPGLGAERTALEAGERHRAGELPFVTPRVIGSGRTSATEWLALSPLPARPHRPAWKAPLADVVAAAGELLAGGPAGPAHPAGWRRMHGDLAPWNLRRVGGTTWLLDWEAASYGPPDADGVYWAAAVAALGRRRPGPAGGDDPSEAVAFWREAVGRRPADDADHRVNRGILAALDAMAPASGTRSA